jgi:predicted LPLAT superfamily acyltransferase
VTAKAAWTAKVERGTLLWFRIVRFLYRTLGRRLGQLILWPGSLYFVFVDRVTRRSSRAWQEVLAATPEGRAALGYPPGLRATWRHVHAFGVNIFDRIILWAGEGKAFHIDHRGGERLLELAAQGRGALLVGAHLGSFDMLRLIAEQYGLRVNVLMFTHNSALVNSYFASLGGASRVRVIALDPNSMRTAFEIRACLERGEFVGVLADRVHAGSRERPVETLFAGKRAAFPLAPFRLGVTLGAPVFLSLCLCTGDARYFAVTEPLFDGGQVPRGERDKVAQELLEAWVRRLEHYALASPYQWFNFYDFWGDSLRAAGKSLT